MATLSDLQRNSAGSNTLIRASFTSVANGETWDSGIQEIVGWWCNATDNPTQTQEQIDVSLSGSTFTFNVGGDTRSCDLCVLAKI